MSVSLERKVRAIAWDMTSQASRLSLHAHLFMDFLELSELSEALSRLETGRHIQLSFHEQYLELVEWHKAVLDGSRDRTTYLQESQRFADELLAAILDQFPESERAQEKAASREIDARALASGEKSREELRRENSAFGFPRERIHIDFSRMKSKL